MGFRIQLATLMVARTIEREYDLGGEFAALLQHLVDDVGIYLGMPGQLLQFVFDQLVVLAVGHQGWLDASIMAENLVFAAGTHVS